MSDAQDADNSPHPTNNLWITEPYDNGACEFEFGNIDFWEPYLEAIVIDSYDGKSEKRVKCWVEVRFALVANLIVDESHNLHNDENDKDLSNPAKVKRIAVVQLKQIGNARNWGVLLDVFYEVHGAKCIGNKCLCFGFMCVMYNMQNAKVHKKYEREKL